MSKDKQSKRAPREERAIRESGQRKPSASEKSHGQKPPRPRPENKGEKR
jgi:hypothetical protein